MFTNLLPVTVTQPEDVADTVLFLASDESRYVTAHELAPDAGLRAEAAALNLLDGRLPAQEIIDRAIHDIFPGGIALYHRSGGSTPTGSTGGARARTRRRNSLRSSARRTGAGDSCRLRSGRSRRAVGSVPAGRRAGRWRPASTVRSWCADRS